MRRGAPPALPTRPRSWPTWPRAGLAEFAQVRLDAACGGAVGSAGRGPDDWGRWRGVQPHLPGGAAASRASAGDGSSRSGGSSSSSSAGQSRRRSAPAGGSMAAGLQPGPRTRSRRESSPRAAQPTSGGSWSLPQLQHRRARGGGGEARRGGGERRGEAGRGKERESQRGGREGEASAGRAGTAGASACGDPALLGAAAAAVPGSLRSRDTPRLRQRSAEGQAGGVQASPPRESSWGALVPPVSPVTQGASSHSL